MAKKENAEAQAKSPFKQTVLNLEFHNFEADGKFIGTYENTIVLGDEEPFNANIFTEIETGVQKFVTDSYSIAKAIKQAKAEYEAEMTANNIVFQIEFLGKAMVKGKPFNRFNIGYCTLEAYKAFSEKA
jgi:hypothetical protein